MTWKGLTRHSSGTVDWRNVRYRDCLVNLAIGKGKQEPQGAICIAQTHLPTPQRQPIYPRLPGILDEHGLDHIAKERPRMGRPRLATGIYFLRKIQQLRQISGRCHGIRLQGFPGVANAWIPQHPPCPAPIQNTLHLIPYFLGRELSPIKGIIAKVLKPRTYNRTCSCRRLTARRVL